MTHLGDRLSALVDGELDGAERDKATAHLARCEQCRSEAAALRDLKRQLRSLATDSPAVAAHEADMVRRLMSMTGVSTQPRRRGLRVLSRPVRGLRPPGPPRLPGPPRPLGPGASRPGGFPGARLPRRPSRYLALGAVTIMVGLGTAAFSAGGGDAAPGPRITPQMELYSEEHAITTGDVPFAGAPGSVDGPAVLPTMTSAGHSARTP
jgi:anti-sigma factor RsiW